MAATAEAKFVKIEIDNTRGKGPRGAYDKTGKHVVVLAGQKKEVEVAEKVAEKLKAMSEAPNSYFKVDGGGGALADEEAELEKIKSGGAPEPEPESEPDPVQ